MSALGYRRGAWSQEEWELAAALRLQGRSLKEITAILNRSHQSVRDKFRDMAQRGQRILCPDRYANVRAARRMQVEQRRAARKMEECLSCRRSFVKEHGGNWICRQCKGTDKWRGIVQ